MQADLKLKTNLIGLCGLLMLLPGFARAEFRISSPVQQADLQSVSPVLSLQDCAAPRGKEVPIFRAFVDGDLVSSQILPARERVATQWWLQVQIPEDLDSEGRHRITLEAICGDSLKTDTLEFSWRTRGAVQTAVGLARHFRVLNRSDLAPWSSAMGGLAWGLDALRAYVSAVDGAELSDWLTGYHRGWERKPEKDRRIHLPGELLPGLSALSLAYEGGLVPARERLRDLIWFLKITPLNEIGALDRWGSSPLAWGRAHGISAQDLLPVSVFAAQAGVRMADRELQEFAFNQPEIYRSKLQDSKTGLYHQVWLEALDRPQNDGSGFSLRVNGQVLMGLVSLVEWMPASDQRSFEVSQMARELAEKLAPLQLPSGGFPLGVGSRYATVEEISSTAWVAAALARGVRLGVLPPVFLEPARRAWDYISSRVTDITPEGVASQSRYSLDRMARLSALPDRREVFEKDAPQGLGPVFLLVSELAALGGF